MTLLWGILPLLASAADCTFRADPNEFLNREARVRRAVADRAAVVNRLLPRSINSTSDAEPIPQRSFIDAEIFGKLAQAGVKPARLSSDEEFVRRIYLDLTGRIPAPEDVLSFLADSAPDKRDALIDKLLYSPEFEAKWNLWLGDLLQITANSSNVNRQLTGRDAFRFWLGMAVYNQKSLKDLAYETVSAVGNTFDNNNGATNFVVNSVTPMGPIQDQYDTMLTRTATAFLGLAYYDCLLCHNGRAHLDQISLWGSRVTRAEAEKMAAFFSRQRVVGLGNAAGNSFDVTNNMAGSYDLNTTFGNRPNRLPIGAVRTLTPEYRETGATPTSNYWRESFAANMVADPMFSRNFANRLWKAMFNLGLVDPVDTLDPARLDPNNPPPAPWAFQATHPLLLQKLADEFVRRNFSLREFLRLLAQSSAYQLSSRYEGDWSVEYVPLFARHYARRLEGEEVHDALAKATGVLGNYLLASGDVAYWAMQLPEPAEPRNDRTGLGAAAFLNAFFRGNRDTQQRSQAGSIQQQLALMNNAFVTNRLKVASAPRLIEVAKIGNNDDLTDALFLLFLSRRPSQAERARSVAQLAKAANAAARNNTIEDIAWALVNKGEFLFSY